MAMKHLRGLNACAGILDVGSADGGAVGAGGAIQAVALPRAPMQTQMRPPPVPDKGKGMARARDEVMDVESLDKRSGHAFPCWLTTTGTPAAAFGGPSLSSLAARTSPSTDFARLTLQSPHP
ncbi:hypothetical protein C8F04DRAFT_1275147 [Mycena alexandri]|uniref:Uncharacterized protein n=1 Tax=Mycena alexandri TaxID=1745969 RepID=A0AAD6S363_9AGAR|nr:hypothetical protein C8F04DRAFT_1275147 [Mycena alexandri]